MNKKIMLIGNNDVGMYNFRKELIDKLINEKYKIYVVLPYGVKVDFLIEMGCIFINTNICRRGISPINEVMLIKRYMYIIKKVQPDVVLTYTIKPNIYAGFICKLKRIPYIVNITGLGTAVENKGLLQKITVFLYSISLNKASCVLFQNIENQQFFVNKKIVKRKFRLLPGSGVNLDYYKILDYPDDKNVEFLFIGRVMKEKGIDEYIKAAKYIHKKYPNTIFHVLGFCEEDYNKKLNKLQEKEIIKYHGLKDDIRPYLLYSHCTIHPSYYPEGISNVLLESAASGRPIITTNRSGCREAVNDGITGYLFEIRNTKELIKNIEKFLRLTQGEKQNMGLQGRKMIENFFDREFVINVYVNEIINALENNKKHN